MAEKGLGKRDLEQAFKGFEKRRDEKMKTFGKKVVDQFHIISEGLIDQIKLLAKGHERIIERLQLMQKENERQHQETRSLVKLSFTELDQRLTNLETQMKEMQEWKKQVEGRLQI